MLYIRPKYPLYIRPRYSSMQLTKRFPPFPGYGESIPVAKEMAAREALKKIFGTEDHAPPIDFTVQGVPQGAAEREKISSS